MSGRVPPSSAQIRAFSSLTFHTRRSGINENKLAWLMKSAPEQIQNPHQESKQYANDNAGHDGEIKAAVATLNHDVARKPANPVRQFCSRQEQPSEANQDSPDNQQSLSDFAKRVHRELFYSTA